MLDTILGLPIHPLIVHATVVIVPTAALAVLLSIVWARFRQWIGWGVIALPVLAVIVDPLTTQSGEALEHRLGHSELIEQHAHLADGLLPWLIALLVGAVGLYLWRPGAPRVLRGRSLPRWLVPIIIAIAAIAAIGTIVDVVLIGHSGATAAWSGTG